MRLLSISTSQVINIAKLILIRHRQSTWNTVNKFTGWVDVPLSKDVVHVWRRSFSIRPPGGESLEDTMQRSLPFFRSRILTQLKDGDNVPVAAHGNSLRSIIMEIDRLSEEEVPNLEIATGIPMIYDVDEAGVATNKVILL